MSNRTDKKPARAAPVPPAPRAVTYPLKIKNELADAIDRLAQRDGRSRGQIMRDSIELGLPLLNRALSLRKRSLNRVLA